MVKVVLREDPDILAISEIRDAETAAAAVSASLTGHFCGVDHSRQQSTSRVSTFAGLESRHRTNLIANGILRGVIGQRFSATAVSALQRRQRETAYYGSDFERDPGANMRKLKS